MTMNEFKIASGFVALDDVELEQIDGGFLPVVIALFGAGYLIGSDLAKRNKTCCC